MQQTCQNRQSSILRGCFWFPRDYALGHVRLFALQDLQRASQESAGNNAALQQLQQELQDLAHTQQQLQAQQDICSSSASTSGKKLQEVTQQLQQLDARLAGQTADLTGLAESVLGCLAAARQHAAVVAAAAATQPPSSYLSNLLGPAVPPPATTAATKQLPLGAWVSIVLVGLAYVTGGTVIGVVVTSAESVVSVLPGLQDEQLSNVDGLVTRLRRQQRAAEFSANMQANLGSPAR